MLFSTGKQGQERQALLSMWTYYVYSTQVCTLTWACSICRRGKLGSWGAETRPDWTNEEMVYNLRRSYGASSQQNYTSCQIRGQFIICKQH